MNTQLVNSLAQIILSLSDEERSLLKKQTDSEIKANSEPNNIYAQILDLENQLKFYETQYQMSSNDFYQKFRTGELGDDIDFFEWSVFYEMWLSARQELKLNIN